MGLSIVSSMRRIPRANRWVFLITEAARAWKGSGVVGGVAEGRTVVICLETKGWSERSLYRRQLDFSGEQVNSGLTFPF